MASPKPPQQFYLTAVA